MPRPPVAAVLLASLILQSSCDLIGTDARRPEEPLLPLAVGNEWTLRAEEDTTRLTERILRSTTIKERTYYVTEGPFLPDTLRRDKNGRVYRIRNGTDQLWIDPSVPDGQTYAIDTSRTQDDVYVRRVTVTRDVRVETPAGTFENGVRFRFDTRGVADDDVSITLVPGIGLVHWANQWVSPRRLVSFERSSS